ncbi:MAG: YesL family protein [Lachnospiraceae bacterium]|nr:YesL family protein [Lachnospiraceae bacterium]
MKRENADELIAEEMMVERNDWKGVDGWKEMDATEIEDTVQDTDDEEEMRTKRFSSDSIPTMLLSKLGDILILHFAFLICSLPIVTIGAAMSATSYVGMKMAAGMDGFVLSNFFKAFKDNFKRSTLYWILCVIASGAIWFSYRYWATIGGMIGMILGSVSVILAILLGMVMLYVFAVQAKFLNTFCATIKNAFLMAIRHLHITILMVLCLGFVVYLMINFSVMQALGAVTGAGLLGLVFGKLYNIVFSSYK